MDTPQKRQAEKLHDLLAAQIGYDWMQDISLTVRADQLYWLVYLAEHGIEAKRDKWKTEAGGLDADKIASLSSWSTNLECLVKRIKSTFPTVKTRGKKS